MSGFDLDRVRQDFPILHQEVNGRPLIYLDNAATTQKPNAVIDAISDYYRSYNANVHRAAHALSDRATQEFESARKKVADFLGARSAEQLIWTSGTSESINLVAASWGRANLSSGDRILVSALEHHSNIVPWQIIAEQTGAQVVPIDVTGDGEIDLETMDALLDERVKMVSVSHVSNALGTVNPVEEIIRKANSVGAKTLVDGAQALAHLELDVEALGCDFYAFSAHKVYGPTGIGGIWGKQDLLEDMPPYQGGGEMIERVSFSGTTYNQLPYKFEAGTPNIAGAIGFGAAIDYLDSLNRVAVAEHEQSVLDYAFEKGEAFAGLTRYGKASRVTGVFSFLLDGVHPSDVGMLLDQQGIALRTGHHCTQPLMETYRIPGTVRASFALYNSKDEVDQLFTGLEKVKQFL